MPGITSSPRRGCPFFLVVATLLVCLTKAFQPALHLTFGSRALHSSSLTRRHAQVQDRVDVRYARAVEAPVTHVKPEAKSRPVAPSLDWASSPHGFPWRESISGSGDDALHYMPFLEWQLQHMGGLGGVVPMAMPSHLAHKVSDKKSSRIGTACFESPDFRKIRMTYVDGGKGMQVFNTVWYPRYDSDAPILGVDLLFFGGFKIMAIIDFQPLSKDAEYLEQYTGMLRPIRSQYPKLCETISNRYFEDTRWFSEHMLFGRLEDASEISSTVFLAFQEYLGEYTSMVRRARQERPPADVEFVKARHSDYDRYNHERDPAGKMFEAHFGVEWAHQFMREVLFELS